MSGDGSFAGMDKAVIEQMWAEMADNDAFKSLVGAFDSISKSTAAQRSTLKAVSSQLKTVSTRFSQYKQEAAREDASSSPSISGDDDLLLSEQDSDLLLYDEGEVELDVDSAQPRADASTAARKERKRNTESSDSSSSSSLSSSKPKFSSSSSSSSSTSRLKAVKKPRSSRKTKTKPKGGASQVLQRKEGVRLAGLPPRDKKKEGVIDRTPTARDGADTAATDSNRDKFVIAVPSRSQIQRSIRGKGNGNGLLSSVGGNNGNNGNVRHARQPVALNSHSTSNKSDERALQSGGIFNKRAPPATVLRTPSSFSSSFSLPNRSSSNRSVSMKVPIKRAQMRGKSSRRPGSAGRHRMLRDATAITSEYDEADSAAVDDYSVQTLIASMRSARVQKDPTQSAIAHRVKASVPSLPDSSEDDEDAGSIPQSTARDDDDDSDAEDAKFRVDNVRDLLKDMRRANRETQGDMYIPSKHVTARPSSASGRRSARRMHAGLDPVVAAKPAQSEAESETLIMPAVVAAPSPPKKESTQQQKQRSKMLARFNRKTRG
jgi:hypothetical protein